jgi:nucleoside-diphosphate-sugar epimerase
MRKVLITGGTGFIGSALARACAAEGDEVRILGQANTPAESQNLRQLSENGFTMVEGSVVDVNTVQRGVRGVDIVYHLAAAQHEAGKPDEHFYNVNVRGTKNMLDASCAAGVRRFVHGSTIGVYQANNGTVGDDTLTVPDNIYGSTKLEAEGIVANYRDKLTTVVIRISETYGPGDWRLLKLFRTILKGKYFHVGKSNNLHHPVYVTDLVNGLRLAAESEIATGLTVVLPGFEVLTSRDMVTTIARALKVPPPERTIPLWPVWTAATLMEWMFRPLFLQPPLHRRRIHFFTKSFRFSGDKARALLGYVPCVSFEEGVRRTAEWYQRMGLIVTRQ